MELRKRCPHSWAAMKGEKPYSNPAANRAERLEANRPAAQYIARADTTVETTVRKLYEKTGPQIHVNGAARVPRNGMEVTLVRLMPRGTLATSVKKGL